MKAPQSIFSVITVNCPGIWAPDNQMQVFLRTSPSSFSFCSGFLSWCQNLPILLMIPKREPLWWAHLPFPSPPPAHAYSSLGEGPSPSLLLLWVTGSGLWTQSGSPHQQGLLLKPTSQKPSFLIPRGIQWWGQLSLHNGNSQAFRPGVQSTPSFRENLSCHPPVHAHSFPASGWLTVGRSLSSRRTSHGPSESSPCISLWRWTHSAVGNTLLGTLPIQAGLVPRL